VNASVVKTIGNSVFGICGNSKIFKSLHIIKSSASLGTTPKSIGASSSPYYFFFSSASFFIC
jgi:hypothetical protein